ncbi:iron reductase domain protein [Aplosporella prunicola CBS 121167]|uniref:Iron reductase domain protein n=1 Tax=Aplosporella prunicola CBS 121167 TaxID=1176127 RepID=A0A6A6B4M5_9PEZI|nr:iron reductase domain protein [Aplosporella prunicola CBS 121167]KAF2138353.1 iron reductase domain protein [Aplosporella prunicola CBS 121167]
MASILLRLIHISCLALVLSLIQPAVASIASLGIRDDTPANSTDPAYSTFVHEPKPNSGNFTFSLTAVKESNDLYMHLFAPATYEWVGVGIGKHMKDAVMFIIYHDSSGKNVTFSPRKASGHTEPTYQSSFDCFVDGSSPNIIPGDKSERVSNWYSVNAHCRNIAKMADLNLNSKEAPFIFAIGPDEYTVESDSKAANLRFHVAHGSFTMDMTQATQQNAEGAGTSFGDGSLKGSNKKGFRDDGKTYGTPAHGLLMCVSFLFVFPIGVLCLRVMERVKLHFGTQVVGSGLVIIGMALGLWIGQTYNKSKHVNSAHQILGLIVVALLVIQLCLGYFHHRLYLQTRLPTLSGKIHRNLGPLVLSAGIINGALGFRFADAHRHNIFYLIIALLVMILVTYALWSKTRKDKKKAMSGMGIHAGAQPAPPPPPPPPYSAHAQNPGLAPDSISGHYNPSANSSRSDIALADMGYGAQPTQPRQMV